MKYEVNECDGNHVINRLVLECESRNVKRCGSDESDYERWPPIEVSEREIDQTDLHVVVNVELGYSNIDCDTGLYDSYQHLQIEAETGKARFYDSDA